MKRTSRRVVTWVLLAAGLGAVGLVGCSGSGDKESDPAERGDISLPLTAQGESGVTYRLRDATFVIQDQYYNSNSRAGAPGAANPNRGRIVVSSETDPNAESISVSLEEGYYYVELLPGWHMEKLGPSGPQTIEVTLLSEESQSVYVSRQSTSWVEYRFGVGGREIWMNGKLNIEIDVQETPGGSGGRAGASAGGAAGRAGASAGGAGGRAGASAGGSGGRSGASG